MLSGAIGFYCDFCFAAIVGRYGGLTVSFNDNAGIPAFILVFVVILLTLVFVLFLILFFRRRGCGPRSRFIIFPVFGVILYVITPFPPII